MVPHCDPDSLAIRAIGEDPDDESCDNHLTGCAHCQSQLDELRAVVAGARRVTAEDHPVFPPPLVWQRVQDVLGMTGTATVTSLASHRARSRWTRGQVLMSAAASVVALAVGMAGGAALRGGADVTPPSDPLVMQAPLTALAASSAAGGTATVHREQGRLVLDVSVRGLAISGGDYYEVWLLDEGLTSPLAIGVLGGATGHFELPPETILTRFPVIDISREPLDGNPAHSSDSVVRGTLPV